jgi:two-component system, NtrC family, sensor histidine kinase HydH
MKTKTKLLIVALITLGTLTIHYYDIIFAGTFGHSHLMHAIHGRLCYIPIVLAAFWFGVRGGLTTAFTISVFTIIYVFISPSGQAMETYGEFTEIAFYFAIGGFSGILLNAERSSRNKKEVAERKLLQAEKFSLLGQMVTSIAHEIKNPLGSIKGAIQILRDKQTPEADKVEFASIIEKEVDRLDNVVRDYLSFAKPVTLKISDVDLGQVIKDAIDQIKLQRGSQNVEINFKVSDIPLIKGDSDRLHQLFLNILLNSVQAMSDGGKIEITCEPDDGTQRYWLECRIMDNGPGIPPDNFGKIFEPFFSTKVQGTGLGLATVKSIVTEHRGIIKAESVVGDGTTFIILFPLDKAKPTT